MWWSTVKLSAGADLKKLLKPGGKCVEEDGEGDERPVVNYAKHKSCTKQVKSRQCGRASIWYSTVKLSAGADLNQLREAVGESGREDEEDDEHPVVEESSMLRHEAVHPQLVPPERLHDLQVMQLVPLLRKVDLCS
jgi:hypothetical protein